MGYDPCYDWRPMTAADRRVQRDQIRLEHRRRDAERREILRKAEARRRAKWDRIRADFARARRGNNAIGMA